MKKLGLLVSVVLTCGCICYGMQQEDVKEKFFKALEEGDLDCVKRCVEQDQTLVNEKTQDGVYAWQKVNICEQASLYEDFLNCTNEMRSYVLRFSDDLQDKQELDECKKREREQKLQGNKFEIFTWLLGVGIDERLNEVFYTICFPDIDHSFLKYDDSKALWIALTTCSYSKKWDEKILEEFNILSDQCEYEAKLRLACREKEEKQKREYPEYFSAIEEDYWKIPYEHVLIPALNDFLTWRQNNKNTIQPEDIQKLIRIAFIGRPFLPEFEELLASIYLDDVAQVLDKDAMLMAMKTRSRAFEPLLKKMLLFSQSDSAGQLNNTFCQALREYYFWWPQGARELVQLKSNVATQHRYELMRRQKYLCDARVSFN